MPSIDFSIRTWLEAKVDFKEYANEESAKAVLQRHHLSEPVDVIIRELTVFLRRRGI